MAEQENKETIVFLPWTVEPQPQTQAVILQQPSETHLRLDATTDKTAISSFVIATVVALALGGFATWLAYWYGRKSFDLTKQSFDTVIAQIEAAKDVTLKSNVKLSDVQIALKTLEIRSQRRLDFIEKARNEMSSLSSLIDHEVLMLVEFGVNFYKTYGDHAKITDMRLELGDTLLGDNINRIDETRLKIKLALDRLIFLLSTDDELQKKLADLWLEYFEEYEKIKYKILDNEDLGNVDNFVEISKQLKQHIHRFLSKELEKALKGE
ncbi:hypothetical protein [uncultured Acinetobacter sp.]|uniref:hypothetical protein n=1 Tax=uncultured Acinetobacter sp. TaxID=165433 RepID=UPI002613FC41|nr:hypothetical protein [uncultured Acinetobacter sp.]